MNKQNYYYWFSFVVFFSNGIDDFILHFSCDEETKYFCHWGFPSHTTLYIVQHVSAFFNNNVKKLYNLREILKGHVYFLIQLKDTFDILPIYVCVYNPTLFEIYESKLNTVNSLYFIFSLLLFWKIKKKLIQYNWMSHLNMFVNN